MIHLFIPCLGALLVGWMLATWRTRLCHQREIALHGHLCFHQGKRAGLLEGRLERSAAPFDCGQANTAEHSSDGDLPPAGEA